MSFASDMRIRALLRQFVFALLCVGVAHVDAVEVNSAVALLAKYAAAQDRLSHNQFQRPLYLDSSETSGSVAGDIYALVNQPFATVDTALSSPDNWCDVLDLHLNIKYCRASTAGQGSVLNVSIGRKYDQPLNDAYPVVFAYCVVAQNPNYLQVRMNADVGPMSTRKYRIAFEAIPLEGGKTFIHLSYSYAYGLAGRLALQVYLGTIGSDKVGFTGTGRQPDGGSSHYIGGIRGLVERNTMRYYLAIEAFLGALSGSPQARLEKRLHGWFAASELYPRQLHEMEQGVYLDMKRKEYLRQQLARPEAEAG